MSRGNKDEYGSDNTIVYTIGPLCGEGGDNDLTDAAVC